MGFPTIPNPVGALMVGVVGAIAACYYGASWPAFGLLAFSILTRVYVFRRARKVYRERQLATELTSEPDSPLNQVRVFPWRTAWRAS